MLGSCRQKLAGAVLSLRFMGEVRVERDGQVLELPPSKKTRALLAYLAVTGRMHRRERLCSLLWDIPDDPRGALRWSLSKIRALVDEPQGLRLVADRETVRFEPRDTHIDVLDLRSASQSDVATISSERLRQVASTSAGEFLEGHELPDSHSFHAWCVAEREEARAARVRVVSTLIERLKQEPDEALPYARTLVDLQSDREESWASLVDLLAAAGRKREAEDQYDLGRRVLKDAGIAMNGSLMSVWSSLRRKTPGRDAAPIALSRLTGTTAERLPAVHAAENRPGTAIRSPPLPLEPSIVVLPFTNMSSDPDDEWFADGLTEDLTTDLSRNAGLFVIARNSASTYKGKAFDLRRISQELGVRYLLEGSARRAAGRVRINAQLIDSLDGKHLWVERFDRTLEDVFAVQDEVAGKIAQALVGRLTAALPRKRPANLEAHDLCMRARTLTEESPQTAREAHLLLKRSIELEPAYAEAHGLLAYNRWLAWTHFGEPESLNRPLAVSLAERAVELDPGDAGCRYFLGTILAYEKRWQDSDAEFGAALERDPNHADTWAAQSDMSVLGGRTAEGLEQIQRAFRLNPYPASWYFCHLGQAQYASGDYNSAIETLRREETYRTNSRRFLAAGLAQVGALDEAHREVEMFLATHPHFTITHWLNSQPLRDGATRDHFVEGFRKAGLPE